MANWAIYGGLRGNLIPKYRLGGAHLSGACPRGLKDAKISIDVVQELSLLRQRAAVSWGLVANARFQCQRVLGQYFGCLVLLSKI